MSSGDKRGRQPDSGQDSRPSKRSRAPDGPPPDHSYTRDQYTIGWVCALPLEMAAAKVMLDKVHPNPIEQDAEDHNTYLLGEVWGHNIVVACLPAGIYGTTTAATVAKDMRRTFRSIRFGLMVGIGGGIPSKVHDIRLGDVVVSQPTATNGGVVQYDRGKSLQEEGFQRTGTLEAPPQVALSALSRLQAEHFTEDSRITEFLADLPQKMKKTSSHPGTLDDCLFQAEYPHVKNNPTCEHCDLAQTVQREARDNTEPVIYYGTIASGNQVIKDAKLRDLLAEEFGALCCEMEAAGLQDFPSIVIRGICDYSDSHKNKKWQPYAAVVAAAFTKELLSFMAPSRVLQADPIPQLVSIAKESLNVSKQHLDISSATLGEQRRINKVLEGRPIDLHIVHEACYDSEDVGSSPRCEANTRVRIQQSIKQWADNENGESFLWLVGPAGTGKSTLIRSVADSFHEDKRLVAGYFFKRGEQDRNDTNRLFSTLAIQLANAIPSFKDSLRVSLADMDKKSIDKKDLGFQFEKLIRNPAQGLPPPDAKEAPRIIVLDALDECERLENLPRVMAFISEICNKATALGLRVILTSRPDPRIISTLEPLVQSCVARKLQLHRLFSDDTKDDIRLYLKTNFLRIKTKANIQQDPWPSVAEVDHLVELSTQPEPLFIYAATLLRFVYDEKRLQNPKNQLKIWIKQCEDNKSQLHQMYNPILEQIFALGKDTDFDQQLQFLGALVLTTLPLSLRSLTELLSLDIDDVNWWLPSLHAVLDIPSDPHKPLKLHHKSFSDFLLSEANPGHDRFRLDAKRIHALLADRCIDLMGRSLKRDICDLKKLDVTPQDVGKDLLGRCIPLELQYSCHYWVYHLRAGGNITLHQILAFLLEHFLHWLEVSALLKQTSVALTVLQGLYDLVKNSSKSSPGLFEFLKDATRTVSSFASIIESAPLQTYASLLLFSPLASRVRQRLWDQRLPSLSHIEGVKLKWDAHMQTIEGSGNIRELVFSPNGKFLASADSVVRLWNASTGTHLVSFEESGSQPVNVTFSPSSHLLAASCSGISVKVWDMTTLTHFQTIKLSFSPIIFTISSNDKISILAQEYDEVDFHRTVSDGWAEMSIPKRSIAISSDHEISVSRQRLGEVQFWNLKTTPSALPLSLRSRRLRRLHRRHIPYHSIAISSDLPLIALCVRQHVILLQNLSTTSTKYILRTGDISVDSITFSPNGKALAGACKGVVFLWDTATHRRISIIEDQGNSYKVNFSSDGQFLVSHSKYETRFWNIATKTYRDIKLGHQDVIAFSSERQILATVSGAASIKLWDLEYAEQQHGVSSSEARTVTPEAFLLLPNDRYVVSQSGCHTLQLWDSLTGELLKSPINAIEISELQPSHDSKSPTLGSHSCESTWEAGRGDARKLLPAFTFITHLGHGTRKPMPGSQLKALRWHIAYSVEGQLVAAWNRNDISFSNSVRFYDANTGSHTYTLDLTIQLATMALFPKDQLNDTTGHPITLDHTTSLESMAFSPCGQTMALGLADGTILLWMTKTRKFQRIIRQFYKVSLPMLVFSPGSEMLAGVSDQIVLWDVATGSCLKTIHPRDDSPQSRTVSSDLRSLEATAPAEDKEILAPGLAGGSFFYSTAFSPNLAFLVAVHVNDSSSNETVALYHIRTAKRQQSLRGHFGAAVHTVFSPNSQMVAVASNDRTVRLWHTTTYQHIHTFKTCIDLPEMTKFSQDGSIIAAASKHRSIRLWDIATGSLSQVIHHNEGLIQDITFLPDEVIVSASAVESDDCRDTHTLKLTNHSYPLSVTDQHFAPESSSSEVSLDLDEFWITIGMEKVILIPPEYRPIKPRDRHTKREFWIRRGHVLLMACSNGQVICFRLAQ